MIGKSELVVSCVASSETRASDSINKSVIITTSGHKPLQIQIVGNHTLVTTKGLLAEKKKVVSKKTKKIETRVQRQVVLEDGRIVADSGPQVITRTLEDSHTETDDCDQNHASLPETDEESDRTVRSDPSILRSVSRTRTTRKSASKEVSHYRDEERREVTSSEELEQAINSPQALLEPILNDFPNDIKGKLAFYSNKSKDIVNKEKVNEVSRLDQNGNIRTVTTHTSHEEETTGEELPEQLASRDLPSICSPAASSQPDWDRLGSTVHVLPITQEPCNQTRSPTLKSGVTSTRNETKNTDKQLGSSVWLVERTTGANGEAELTCVKRKDPGAEIWDTRSSRDSRRNDSSHGKSSLHFETLRRKTAEKETASSNHDNGIPLTASGRKLAERRQRGVFLDGHESCPSPPEVQATAKVEENHYETLWSAHTGERRSPSPTKSETFTKSRGRRIAQMLAARRASKRD